MIIKEMNAVNPKYVLRNWMAVLAYDQASKAASISISSGSSSSSSSSSNRSANDNQEGKSSGYFSLLNELQSVLEKPYDEQSKEMHMKWYRKTPLWAESKLSLSTLLCIVTC